MVPVWWIHYHLYQINWISLSFLACPFLLCLWKVSKNLTKCPAQKLDSRLWKRICFFWTLGTCWQIKTAHFVKRIFHFLWFLDFRDFFIWGWYSGQKRRVLTNSRHLSSTNEFRLSVEDIYFFSLTVFLNVPNLCHPLIQNERTRVTTKWQKVAI